MSRPMRLVGTFAVLVVVVLVSQSQAGAAERPQPAPLITSGHVTVDTFASHGGELVSRQTFGPETAGSTLESDSIGMAPRSGTSTVSSTASGCRRVTVVNRGSTWLGATAYEFNTWTYWCWTRATQVTSNISVGWSISDVDSQYYWQGVVNTELDRYDYSTNDGHPYSAFKHYRQGRFDNCVLKYGCLGTVYPANTIRSYYNGTWAWSTEG